MNMRRIIHGLVSIVAASTFPLWVDGCNQDTQDIDQGNKVPIRSIDYIALARIPSVEFDENESGRDKAENLLNYLKFDEEYHTLSYELGTMIANRQYDKARPLIKDMIKQLRTDQNPYAQQYMQSLILLDENLTQ